jgi:hypothetical protein
MMRSLPIAGTLGLGGQFASARYLSGATCRWRITPSKVKERGRVVSPLVHRAVRLETAKEETY